MGAQHAILRRSARQTYPYTCTVTFKNPSPPRCGGTGTAKAAAEKKKQAAATKQDTSSPSAAKRGEPAATAKSASCSDITGTNSKAPAAAHCKDADRALYAARQIRQSHPQVAAAEYKKAAAAARNAGDMPLELSILREAAEAVAPAVVAAAPPSAAPAQATPPAQTAPGAVGRLWDGSFETCNTANATERATAGWYDICVQDAPSRVQTSHRPHPDPIALGKQAREKCGSYSRDTQQCFSDFKLAEILRQNPGLRETCEKEAAARRSGESEREKTRKRLGLRDDNAQDFLECVDNLYLYGSLDGPPQPSTASVRAMMKQMFRAKRDAEAYRTAGQEAAARDRAAHLCPASASCCPEGQGMKPLPGSVASGAWGCQPLGLAAFEAAQPSIDAADKAAVADDAESRIDEAVSKAVAFALEAAGRTMSGEDREACRAAALAAAWSVYKGGAAVVPEQCLTMANVARAQVARYSVASVDNANSAMEDLLAGFRDKIGAPLPGMIGLTPDERMQRVAECMRQGGTAESCM